METSSIGPAASTFAHDCESCRRLATVVDGGRRFDLYACPEEGGVVARFGHEGWEYSSLPLHLARTEDGPLRVAAALVDGGL